MCLDFGDDAYEEAVEEVVRLVESAGVRRHQVIRGKRSRPDPKFYAGSGKVAEIAHAAEALNAAFVIFNHALSPAQERNVERQLERRVMDRSELILEIFAQRAQTAEGKLQVELAQLEHLATRVKTLKGKLLQLRKQRTVQRRARARGEVLSVSIVGYTNAGKSTLFNALAHAKAYEADQLFATLDTTTRRIWIPDTGNVVLSDTVGFIRDLPHGLVAAFRATLEETVQADLLLHVVDSASKTRDEQVREVDKVLAEIPAGDAPRLLVWNKIDVARNKSATAGLQPGIERDQYGRICRVFVSARTGAGLEGLRAAIAEFAKERQAARLAAAAPTLPLQPH